MHVRRVLLRPSRTAVAVFGLVLAIGMAASWFAGWRLEVVTSASMEPTVPEGALAVTAPVAPRLIADGDVVTYRDPQQRRALVMHRVVARTSTDDGRFFETQGDANETPDPLLVPEELVEGRLRWSIPRLGDALRWLSTAVGRIALLTVALAAVARDGWRWRRRRNGLPPLARGIAVGSFLTGAAVTAWIAAAADVL